jgi:hypothetical protein
VENVCRVEFLSNLFFNRSQAIVYEKVNILYHGISQCRIRHENVMYLAIFVYNLDVNPKGDDTYYYRGRE